MNEDRTVLMSARALSQGHEILWYTVDKVLGQGGFGITYLAHDRNLDRSVAIKEYLPTPFAYRHQDLTVKPLTGDHKDNFAWGLNSFLKEAQTLAKFGHDNIVRVHSVFEANNTAYMVMEYEHGENLASLYQSRGGNLDQTFFERTFFPIFDGLEQIHRFGFIHRDIKPANIYIREDGTPVLIDFGSARQTSQQETGEMTTLVSKGYTPLEQYSSNYGDQGPWTDIYALAASMYEGVTGKKPDESLSRSACMMRRKPDLVQRLPEQSHMGFDQRFLDSIISGLSLEPEARPKDLSEWLEEFQHGPGVSQTTHSGNALDSAGNTFTAAPRRTQPARTTPSDPSPMGRAAQGGRLRSTDMDDSLDFDLLDDSLGKADKRDDIFADDLVRPASPATGNAARRGSSKSGKKSSGKSKTGAVLAGFLGIAAAGGLAYYFLAPGTVLEPLAVESLNQLPRPASAVSTILPKEQVVQELEDMLRLGGTYQRALSTDASNQNLLTGLDELYDQLAKHTTQWHASRHNDLHDRIVRVVNTLPERGQKKQAILAAINASGNLTSLDRVRSLLIAGDIASPSGASVLDEVNRLSKADYTSLTKLPEWKTMMNTLSQSTAEKLGGRDFTAAARIVEAALSLEPDNVQMLQARAHLNLRN
ncbi:MAG: serine/threonine protein kinase [Granulosicoccus sp.]